MTPLLPRLHQQVNFKKSRSTREIGVVASLSVPCVQRGPGWLADSFRPAPAVRKLNVRPRPPTNSNKRDYFSQNPGASRTTRDWPRIQTESSSARCTYVHTILRMHFMHEHSLSPPLPFPFFRLNKLKGAQFERGAKSLKQLGLLKVLVLKKLRGLSLRGASLRFFLLILIEVDSYEINCHKRGANLRYFVSLSPVEVNSYDISIRKHTLLETSNVQNPL